MIASPKIHHLITTWRPITDNQSRTCSSRIGREECRRRRSRPISVVGNSFEARRLPPQDFRTLLYPVAQSAKQQTPGPSLLSSLTRDIHAFCIASNIESLLLSANNWWRFNVRSAFGICFTLAICALKLQRPADFGANYLVTRSGFRRRLLGARRKVRYIRLKSFGNES